MLPYAFLIICYILGLVRKSTSVYIGGTSSRQKKKLVALDRDLTIDAINNGQRVHHFKSELYEEDDAFHIGKLMIKIRSKFGRMVRLHAISQDHYEDYDINKHILHLTEIQHLAMEIDNLVQILLDYEWEGNKRQKKLSAKQKEKIMKEQKGYSNLPNSSMTLPGILRNRGRTYNKQFVAARAKLEKWRSKAEDRGNNGGGFDSDEKK